MTFVAPAQDALPDAHALFPEHEPEHHEAVGAQLPEADGLFPALPPDRSNEPQRRAAGILGPLKGAVMPGPVGDWIFGNAQHSSLARIMHAFGGGFHEAIGDYATNNLLTEENQKYLKQKGLLDDYVSGQRGLLKSSTETLLRSGALVVNDAIYGVPAVFHGLQDAVMEAGEQAQGTEVGKAVGAKGLARTIAGVPGAIPDFNFGPYNTKAYGHALMNARRAPVPAPLTEAVDLNVIGPGGEAAWKGIPTESAHEPGGSTAPVEAAAEALPSTPAAAPDIHARARTIAPEVFTEFDALEKRRDLFRKWIDDPETTVPPSVPKELNAVEARLRELEPQVTAAYEKAKEGHVGSSADTAETGTPPTEAGPPVAAQAEEGAIPAEGASPARMAGEEGTEAPRAIEDQRDYIVQDVKRQLKAAGRPEEEAQTVAQLVAARYETRAARMNGALGTAEELYDREAAEIRGQQIRAKIQSAPGRAALEGFQERMAQGKDAAQSRRDESVGSPFPTYARAEGRYANMSKEDLKAMQDAYEDSIEALEPEERAGAREEFTHDDAKELYQASLGKIDLDPLHRPGTVFTGVAGTRPVLTLMKNANASTAVHELGHEWLAQMLRDAEHEKAPAEVQADRDAVLKWFGVDKTGDIATRHHEKFARGFEQYLREGVAPSQRLAKVFAKFKDWLSRIYQTLKGLGAPISDDIRRVFDRMLEQNPQRVTVAPEREVKPEFHERHAEAAETIAEEHARDVSGEIQTERDSIAEQNVIGLGNADARLENVEPRAGSRPSGTPQSAGDADATGNAGTPGASPQVGSELPRGGEVAPEGAGVLPAARSEVENPNTRFETPPNDFIDKAGNIRLDKLNQPDDIDAVIRTAARNNNDFLAERRGVLSDGQTLDLADALGVDPAWLDRKKIGDAYNVEEIRAARRLLVQSATGVRDAMIEAKGGDPAALQKLAEAIARHEMIQGKVSGATAEAGRALRAFREKLPGQEEAATLSTWLKANTGRDLFQLQEMAKYGANLTSPSQVSRFVHDTANGRIKQAIIFYYVNSLISGPITHTRYFAGNALTAMWAPVKTTVAAALDSAATMARLQDERRIFFGEAGAELYALGKGSREGWKAAGDGWVTGNTPHLPGEAPPNMFESQPTLPPIPGPIGAVIGLPGKAVGAIHGFSSAVRYEQEIAKLAYRQASREGLSGEEFISRVADLGNRPPPEMTEAAAKIARSDLYMAPADFQSMESRIARLANSNVVTKIILPFTKIGTQIASQAIKNSPLGVFSEEVRANLSGKNGIEARNTQAAAIVASTALMGTTAQMVAEGLVTGAGPDDPNKKREWLLTHKPYHITIGSVSVPYRGLGALGMQMAIAANAYETHQGWGDDEGHAIALEYLKGMQEAVLDDTWLRGIKDMLDAAYHFEEYGDRWVSNMVTNWLPFSVGIGQINRAYIDPYQRETKGSTLLDSIFKEAQAKVPWFSQGLFPRRDMFGEPIPAAGEGPDYANDPVVKMMDSLHLGVGRLSRKIRGIDLTDAQFDDYARVAGRTAKMHLDDFYRTTARHLLATGLPEDRAKIADQIHKIMTQARESTATSIMQHATGSENDIWKKATNAKKIKKGLVAPDTVH